MAGLKYTKEHEWIRVDGDMATVGISDYAQEQLGDVVYVELPEPGEAVTRGSEAAVVESVKAASDIYMPGSGEVSEINEKLHDEPETVNESPTGEGWFMKIRLSDSGELDGLMDEMAYSAFIETIE